jgi:hypothetical protein
MSLLVSAAAVQARTLVARDALAPLAHGLRRELEPLIAGDRDVPAAKAWLTRAGGRCDRDGTLLRYDSFDPRHRCAQCGREVHGVEHDRFRLYWHHLWLAERALHGALLGVLLDDDDCIALAHDLLDAYATRYLDYPNRDNVLGPSRPFFSTYLESIWLLQLTMALDLLESSRSTPETAALGARVRDRLIAPSCELIASFDEGMSNRQVWNNAALLAAGRLLGDQPMIDRAIGGPSGLEAHLGDALLADGSWYEGENYHLFAHRGLWYGVQLAECAGHRLPRELDERFRAGFAAPFRTVLPDLTYPSRRDSQYAVSVRQPRFAEACELGLARGDDERLVGMLARLYDPAVPRRDTGRSSSSADVERNLPATGLTRADLSWRALLVAREALPPLHAIPLRSDLLPAQGLAILRRDDGALYASLDYGHSGGGHGHPDRLNVMLVDGDVRWFDDPGTGSYVDRSLHWYRSTLAHHAPLVDGHSQPRVHGNLVAFEDGERAGWVCADVELAPGLHVRRSLVVLDDYLVDLLQWEGETDHDLALPLHGVDLVDERDAALPREEAPIAGGDGVEDGFGFLEQPARIWVGGTEFVRALGRRDRFGASDAALRGWIQTGRGTSWWSASAPTVPSRPGRALMLLARQTARRGGIMSVWTWRDAIAGVETRGDELNVRRRDGRRDMHVLVAQGWRMDLDADGERATAVLGGFVSDSPPRQRAGPGEPVPSAPAAVPASFDLGEEHYRRSEQTWREAGAPRAHVAIAMGAENTLRVAVRVEPSHRLFVAPGTVNPLDNESAGINGDGLQLYVECVGSTGGWLLVPESGAQHVDAHPVADWNHGLEVHATWHPTDSGYVLDAIVPLPDDSALVSLDVVVNETAPGRERRRGQLVLSGAHGEFVYLRGDRHDARRLLRFTIPDA